VGLSSKINGEGAQAPSPFCVVSLTVKIENTDRRAMIRPKFQAVSGFDGVKQFNCESTNESALTHPARGVSFGL